MLNEESRFARALAHRTQAAGASLLQHAFSFDAEQDLRFALGWPHLKYLDANHPHDLDGRTHRSSYGLIYPARVASLRLQRRIAPNARADRRGQPLTADDVRTSIVRELEMLEPPGNTYELLYLAEALFGPELVTNAITETLEQWTPERLAESCTYNHVHAHYLGFGLLRLKAKQTSLVRARLENVYRRAVRKVSAPFAIPSVLRVLDFALHGAEGAERSGKRDNGAIHPWCLLHVTDSAELVKSHVLRQRRGDVRFFPFVRMAFLSGPGRDEVIDHYARIWSVLTDAADHRALVEEFGEVRSEHMLPWMLELSARSRARREALAWFVRHADFARSFLEATARSRRRSAEWAEHVLKRLSGGPHGNRKPERGNADISAQRSPA
jgi:hypothetical protein